MNLFNIKDKVAVITGGTGVLGSSIAEHLAASGAKIVIFRTQSGNNRPKHQHS